MKKSFSLRSANKATERLVDAIKHDVRKYVKRERNKAVPPPFNTWEFDCRVGKEEASAQSAPLPSISSAIDAIVGTGSEAVYVEVVARPAHRVVQQRAASSSSSEPGSNTPSA